MKKKYFKSIPYTLNDSVILWKGEYGEPMFWLFEVKKGKVFRLNETAYYILSQFDGNRTIKDIAKNIMEVFEVSEEKVITDIERCIKKWTKDEIIVIKEKDNVKKRTKKKNREK